MCTGVYPGFAPEKLPAVPGLDGVGRVEKMGPGTSGRFKQGQRVVAVPWNTKTGNGSWQQYATVPEAALVAVPDELPDEAACQFTVNPLTAMGFFDVLQVPEGEWLLNNAAGSVLGRMVIKLAKKKGVKTINLVRRRESAEEIKKFGGDEVLVSTEDDVPAKVHEITGGKGAWAALEPVCGPGTAAITASIRDSGVCLVYGAMQDFTFTGGVGDVLFRYVNIKGFWLNRWLASIGNRRDEIMKETMQYMVDGTLAPYCGKKFPIDQIKEAVEETSKPGRGGKVLVEG